MDPADRISLVAIIEYVTKVRAYVRQTGDTWTTDDMTVDAIAKRLEEIGELSKRLGPDTLERMPLTGVASRACARSSCTTTAMSRSSSSSRSLRTTWVVSATVSVPCSTNPASDRRESA